MSMVDRVARAIEDADLGYSITLVSLVDGVSTYELHDSDRHGPLFFPSHAAALEHINEKRRRAKARAAIEAMREPTANMSLIGIVQSDRDDIDLTLEEVDDIWTAMVIAALSEEEERG